MCAFMVHTQQDHKNPEVREVNTPNGMVPGCPFLLQSFSAVGDTSGLWAGGIPPISNGRMRTPFIGGEDVGYQLTII